ncbi:hypothetical protein HHI36_016541 [Cryptolaemus montrouzieri]|uniref:Endonuclease/exonuclease/phosphatase domain-containing protein n=1 Tax=Cryptolaemus montrouzieri TaxID=559131 RepID=A0ABD2NKX1_9CUCU
MKLRSYWVMMIGILSVLMNTTWAWEIIVERMLDYLFCKYSRARIVVTGDLNVHFGSGDGDSTRLCDLTAAFSLKKMISVPTRRKNCIDNIFINFASEVSEANSLSTTEFNHSAVTLKVKIPLLVQIGHKKKSCRPITSEGLFNYFGLSWDFVRDDALDVNIKSDRFMQILKTNFEIAFPMKTYNVKDSSYVDLV